MTKCAPKSPDYGRNRCTGEVGFLRWLLGEGLQRRDDLLSMIGGKRLTYRSISEANYA